MTGATDEEEEEMAYGSEEPGALYELPLYLEPPHGILQAGELETIVHNRLELLKDIGKDRSAQLETDADIEMREDLEYKYVNEGNHARDSIGHFILRLVFCESHALREWLVSRELMLLANRWQAAGRSSRQMALRLAGFVPKLDDSLASSFSAEGAEHAALSCPTCYYEMHFTALPSRLLAERRVSLHAGIARVPETESYVLLAECFEAHLRNDLALAAAATSDGHALPSAVASLVARLRPVAENLLTVYEPRTHDRDIELGGLTLENFEEYLRRSFPPCMKHLVLHQRSGQHLKNAGRLQLRPFLREAGLSLEGSMRWWLNELLRDPNVSKRKFESKYAYQIEHAYGKRGHGRLAFGFSCGRLAGLSGGVVGCPFQAPAAAAEAARLPFGRLLAAWGAEGVEGEAISAALERGATELEACSMFFRASHPAAPAELLAPFMHPNEFLRRSRAYYLHREAAGRRASDGCLGAEGSRASKSGLKGEGEGSRASESGLGAEGSRALEGGLGAEGKRPSEGGFGEEGLREAQAPLGGALSTHGLPATGSQACRERAAFRVATGLAQLLASGGSGAAAAGA